MSLYDSVQIVHIVKSHGRLPESMHSGLEHWSSAVLMGLKPLTTPVLD